MRSRPRTSPQLMRSPARTRPTRCRGVAGQVAAAWGGDRRLDTIDAVAPLVDERAAGRDLHLGGPDRARASGRATTAIRSSRSPTGWRSSPRWRPGGCGQRIRAHRSAYLLAEAWAAGRLAQLPHDGQERIDHLELRLGELYDHCAALGLAVDREVALAVVAIHGLPGCDEARRAVLTRAPRPRPGASSPPASPSWCSRAAGSWCWPSAARTCPVRTRRLAQAIESTRATGTACVSATGSSPSRRTAPTCPTTSACSPPDRCGRAPPACRGRPARRASTGSAARAVGRLVRQASSGRSAARAHAFRLPGPQAFEVERDVLVAGRPDRLDHGRPGGDAPHARSCDGHLDPGGALVVTDPDRREAPARRSAASARSTLRQHCHRDLGAVGQARGQAGRSRLVPRPQAEPAGPVPHVGLGEAGLDQREHRRALAGGPLPRPVVAEVVHVDAERDGSPVAAQRLERVHQRRLAVVAALTVVDAVRGPLHLVGGHGRPAQPPLGGQARGSRRARPRPATARPRSRPGPVRDRACRGRRGRGRPSRPRR